MEAVAAAGVKNVFALGAVSLCLLPSSKLAGTPTTKAIEPLESIMAGNAEALPRRIAKESDRPQKVIYATRIGSVSARHYYFSYLTSHSTFFLLYKQGVSMI
jgi:hypothetical protein